LEYSVTTQAK